MNLTEIFHEYLAEIYWKGYADYLLQNDVKLYQWELHLFTCIYSS